MTNQLTQTQTEALEFFEDNFQDVQAYGLHILGGREERQLYRQGKDLVNLQIDSLRRQRGRLVPYTNEERYLIASLYNEGHTRKFIETSFIDQFGNTHTVASIGQKVEMCKSADKTHSSHTEFQFRDDELITILQGLDSDRYQA